MPQPAANVPIGHRLGLGKAEQILTYCVSLEGKRAIVTGGASGIGAVTAGILRDLGAAVAITDINEDGLATVSAELGGCPTFVCDVSDEGQAESTVAAAVEALVGLDIAVNAAGIVDEVKYALERDMEPWQRIMDINFRGTYQICRAAARTMVPNGTGAIVNIASISGLRASTLRVAYGTSKAAVIHLTEQQAAELGEYGIRANTVAPGPVRTKLAMAVHSQAIRKPACIRTSLPCHLA